MEEWRRMREAEAEERRLAAQVEERRIAAEERRINAEAEDWRIAAEAKERRLAAQAEERRITVEERKAELQVEKLRLELEARKLSQSQNGEQFNQGLIENVVRTPPPPSFVDRKDNLDEYLLRFEKQASVAKWNRSIWATRLSSLLTGKAIEVYNKLSPEEEMDDSRTNTPGQIPTGQIPTGHIPTRQLPPLQNTPWTYTHHKMKCEEKP